MTPRELAAQWRTESDTLAKYDERLARVLVRHAEELEAALLEQDEQPLALAEAARESGYSVDRLRHKIAAGEIANAGVKGAPRVRRIDLPRKRRQTSATFDANATARAIVAQGTSHA